MVPVYGDGSVGIHTVETKPVMALSVVKREAPSMRARAKVSGIPRKVHPLHRHQLPARLYWDACKTPG